MKTIFNVTVLIPRSFIAVFAAFGCFISIYYLPIYFQFTRGAGALETAKYILPFILFLSACVLLNGEFMGRTGYAVPWYIWGTSLQLIGGVLMCKSFPSLNEPMAKSPDRHLGKSP